MSLPEKPRKLPAQYDAKAVEQVIQDIYTALNGGFTYLQLQLKSTDPDRIAPGMVFFADGTTFAPVAGYGPGLYRVTTNNGYRKLLDHNRPLMANPRIDGMAFYYQAVRTVVTTANATLTGAELLTRHIQYTGAGGNLTTPTGTQIDAAITTHAGAALDDLYAFDFFIVNAGGGAATVVLDTDVISFGSLVVAAGTSAYFQCRKRGTNLFTITRFA